MLCEYGGGGLSGKYDIGGFFYFRFGDMQVRNHYKFHNDFATRCFLTEIKTTWNFKKHHLTTYLSNKKKKKDLTTIITLWPSDPEMRNSWRFSVQYSSNEQILLPIKLLNQECQWWWSPLNLSSFFLSSILFH